jgi:hypothetical protein
MYGWMRVGELVNAGLQQNMYAYIYLRVHSRI